MDKSIQELFSLKEKVFLVAGGAHNLGRDISFALAEAGARGILTSRNGESANNTAKEIATATQMKIIGLPLNAMDEGQVKGVFEALINSFGRLDILVNCVGGGALQRASAKFEEYPLDAWESMHNVNLRTVFLMCRQATSIMKAQRTGSIINIGSIAGIIGRDRRVYPPDMVPQAIGYASAKSAVIGFSRDLAAYLGPFGIRVNTISPGGFERNQPDSFIRSYSDKVPLKRMAKDGIDIKGAALFLASDASSYVTGHNLVVDGGFTTWQ